MVVIERTRHRAKCACVGTKGWHGFYPVLKSKQRLMKLLPSQTHKLWLCSNVVAIICIFHYSCKYRLFFYFFFFFFCKLNEKHELWCRVVSQVEFGVYFGRNSTDWAVKDKKKEEKANWQQKLRNETELTLGIVCRTKSEQKCDDR